MDVPLVAVARSPAQGLDPPVRNADCHCCGYGFDSEGVRSVSLRGNSGECGQGLDQDVKFDMVSGAPFSNLKTACSLLG